jgi:hypothetical protein
MQRPVYAEFFRRHHGKLSRDDIRAVKRHEKVLCDAEAFEGFAGDIRAGRLVAGGLQLLRRPGALRFLSGPPLARLARMARRLGHDPGLRPG